MQPVIVLEDVTALVRRRIVWSGATFSVRPGSFTAVVGPNGAGKTTLLRLLLGLAEPAAGTVRVLGEPPRRGSRQIGYVPQRRALDPDTPVLIGCLPFDVKGQLTVRGRCRFSLSNRAMRRLCR